MRDRSGQALAMQSMLRDFIAQFSEVEKQFNELNMNDMVDMFEQIKLIMQNEFDCIQDEERAEDYTRQFSLPTRHLEECIYGLSNQINLLDKELKKVNDMIEDIHYDLDVLK